MNYWGSYVIAECEVVECEIGRGKWMKMDISFYSDEKIW
jgi:hypothetical protein